MAALGPDDPAFSETTPYRAQLALFGVQGRRSDHLVRAYHHTYGLETTTTNCSNNYGPYQFPEKLIPLFLINCLTGKPLPIYGDGMNVRDWLHVEDHCRGIDAGARAGPARARPTISAAAQELPNLDVIDDDLRAASTRPSRPIRRWPQRFPDAPAAKGRPIGQPQDLVTDRPGHDRRYAIDERKSAHRARLRAARELSATGFAETLAWYLANEAWWRAVMDGSYQNWIERNYGRRAASA